jgi:prepilin-type processing-associated H-X9-DG protein
MDVTGKGMLITLSDPRFRAKLASIRNPSHTFGFLDEHPDSIDDGAFTIYDPAHWAETNGLPEYRTWMEMPADRHRRGCNLSFTDGHTEHWRWQWAKNFDEYDQRLANDLDKADLQRLQACLPTR